MLPLDLTGLVPRGNGNDASSLLPSSGREATLVIDFGIDETRQTIRRWLMESNRAAQVLEFVERAPPTARPALIALLERLVLGDESSESMSRGSDGVQRLTLSRERHLASAEAQRLRITMRSDAVQSQDDELITGLTSLEIGTPITELSRQVRAAAE